MFGLVLIVGQLIDSVGRHRALVGGLVIMAVSTVMLAWAVSIPAMSLSLFLLGIGWNVSYVAASAELVTHAAPVERGRLSDSPTSSRACSPPRSRSSAGSRTRSGVSRRSRSGRPSRSLRPRSPSSSPAGRRRRPSRRAKPAGLVTALGSSKDAEGDLDVRHRSSSAGAAWLYALTGFTSPGARCSWTLALAWIRQVRGSGTRSAPRVDGVNNAAAPSS